MKIGAKLNETKIRETKGEKLTKTPRTKKTAGNPPADTVVLGEEIHQTLKYDISFLKSAEDSDIWGNRYYYRPYAEVPRTNRVAKALLGKTKFAKISFSEAEKKIGAGEPVTFRMKRKTTQFASRVIEPGIGKTPLEEDRVIKNVQQLHGFVLELPDRLYAASRRYLFTQMNKLEAAGKIRPGVVPAVVHTNDGRAIDTKTGKYIDPK